MEQKYIDFLIDIKQHFKCNNYYIIGEKNNIELMEAINRYITYLWYKQTNDKNYIKYDSLYIPNVNITIDFNNIDMLSISNIFSYIKYDLLIDIDDILFEKSINMNYLKNFSNNKIKQFLLVNNISYNEKSNIKKLIQIIIDNKKKLFKHIYKTNTEIKKSSNKYGRKKKIIKNYRIIHNPNKDNIKKLIQKLKNKL